MTIVNRTSPNNFQGRKILQASFLILDVQFHKTSQLEILRNMAIRGYDTSLIAVRSKNMSQIRDFPIHLISVPLRYVPIISPMMFAVTLFFFLPWYIVVSKPDYIITEPDVSIFGFASAVLFSKFKRIKSILDVRSTPVETVGHRGHLRALSFTMSVLIAKKFFDGMTTITPLMKKEICERFNINPKMVGVWLSGVCPEIFDPESYVSEGAILKKELGLSKSFIVFYHGIFTASRGLTETIEAMSCGLPVVATNIGGNNEVISSGLNGFLVSPKCPEEMANAILELLADSALREKIGRAARETIEKRYTWDKITDNILNCYENIL